MPGHVIVYGYGTKSAYVFALFPDEDHEIALNVFNHVRQTWERYGSRFSFHLAEDIIQRIDKKDQYVLRKRVLSEPSATPKLKPKAPPSAQGNVNHDKVGKD